MSLLDTIQTGPQERPRRVLVYGTQGIGKSTFAANAPKPIFIQTEDGIDGIHCSRFPQAQNFDEVMQALGDLYAEEHVFKTVVIDSLDWLEKLIWAEVCKRRGVESIDDIGYAKGYSFALTYWREFLDGLAALRNDKGLSIIFIAHAKIETFQNPETESYDRYCPNLHKHVAALVQEWCDEVFFATYKVHTKNTDEGFNKKRAQGIGTGERVMRTCERPAHLAKNRLDLPEELPLEWAAYAHFVTESTQQKGA